MRFPIKTTFLVALLTTCGAAYLLSRNTLEQMVGQMIMTGFHGDGEKTLPDDFAAVSEQVRRGQIGGVILFDVETSGNIKNLKQVRKMIKRLSSLAPNKLLIAIDQEGGHVQRLKSEHGFVSTPGARVLSQGMPADTYSVAYDMGMRLADLGINVNFAPVLDVDVDPKSPAIGAHGRSFSDNPDTVYIYANAFASGLSDAGVSYSFKHFPGHGSAGTDSHLGLTDVTKTYQEYELDPWRKVVSDMPNGGTVMVAHIVNRNIDDVPASLSQKHIQILRDMGFDGVIFSDDMDMGAISKEYGLENAVKMAINAGNDILIFGNNLLFDKNRGRDINAMIVDMVRRGEISESRIRESYGRIMRLKRNIGHRKAKRKNYDNQGTGI